MRKGGIHYQMVGECGDCGVLGPAPPQLLACPLEHVQPTPRNPDSKNAASPCPPFFLPSAAAAAGASCSEVRLRIEIVVLLVKPVLLPLRASRPLVATGRTAASRRPMRSFRAAETGVCVLCSGIAQLVHSSQYSDPNITHLAPGHPLRLVQQ